MVDVPGVMLPKLEADDAPLFVAQDCWALSLRSVATDILKRHRDDKEWRGAARIIRGAAAEIDRLRGTP